MQVDLRDDEGLEVQMAPLIDCVFLLLIFFLVASTLKKIDKELPLTLPDAKAAVEVQQPDEFLVVSVDRDGNFYIDGTPVSVNLLQNNLRAIAGTNPGMKIRLDADHLVPFERVMMVMDICRFEGLSNVAVNSRRNPTAGPADDE